MEYMNLNNPVFPLKRCKQVINYGINPNKKFCYFQPIITKKVSSSQNMRISSIVRNNRGGRLQFINNFNNQNNLGCLE
jgi:hypothetical protein